MRKEDAAREVAKDSRQSADIYFTSGDTRMAVVHDAIADAFDQFANLMDA